MPATTDHAADLPPALTSIAEQTGRSLDPTKADLIRCGSAVPGGDDGDALADPVRISKVTGLPMIRSGRPVTAEDVRAVEDE